MTPPNAESQPETESGLPLHERVRRGVLHTIEEWTTENFKKTDVHGAKLQAYEDIHTQMHDGWMKDLHAWSRPLAEIDATASQWAADGKSAVFNVLRTVAGPEFPLLLVIPKDAPSLIDTAVARVSGLTGSISVKVSNWEERMFSGAMEAVRGGAERAYQWITSPFKTTPSAPMTAGGVA